ncbi:hypothetical protein ACM46_14220 [Chryseobacterium angstadtii]|uniref:DUF4293 family protein n=1 Tax=Chryseobacterium angstadtii TaxID=558151 RepID=A0A0J7IB60_9FLAO|nr:hypothetical protein [Chryseobacterium angstadtii]KMQ63091.1 hypothetical protein ACM46_14220 [Chryseobacterium angstadtii]
MKRRVFKYKIVYWLSILINLIFSALFWFATVNRIITNSFLTKRDFIYSLSIVILAILSTIGLVSLIIKNKRSIRIFSYTLILLMATFTLGVLESIFISGNFGNDINDYVLSPILYLMMIGILILIQKSKDNSMFLEIEEIGRHTD